MLLNFSSLAKNLLWISTSENIQILLCDEHRTRSHPGFSMLGKPARIHAVKLPCSFPPGHGRGFIRQIPPVERAPLSLVKDPCLPKQKSQMLGGRRTNNLGREGPPSHPGVNPSKGSLVGCLEWPFELQNAGWEISRCGTRNENGYNCSRHPSKQKSLFNSLGEASWPVKTPGLSKEPLFVALLLFYFPFLKLFVATKRKTNIATKNKIKTCIDGRPWQ